MPNDINTKYQYAALLTVELVHHSHTPDDVSDAILEMLINMAGETDIKIWLWDFGLSLEGLTQLYSRQEHIGGGKRRAILYGDYEIGRKKDDNG